MWAIDPDKFEFELQSLEEIRFRIDRFLLMPKHEAWLRREAFVRKAYSSTRIENPSITEAEQAQAETELTITRPDVANYASALEFVDFLSSQNHTADELTVKQIHWLLMRNLRDDHYLPGDYRKDTNWIEDNGVKVYQPPHQLDAPSLMREFVLALQKSELHPVLRAGLAHIHLVAIHPFVDGNGRTARLLATLVLQTGGWGFRNLLSLDSFYQRNRDAYIEALRSTLGSTLPPEYDATPWLDFFCGSVLVEARRLESRLTDWQMGVDQIHRELRPTGLLDRQIEGLLYATRRREITRRDYIEIAAVSPVTATRDLAALVERGFLRPEGRGRNRVYKMNQPETAAQELPSEPPGQQRLL